jgi:hypothetical protein
MRRDQDLADVFARDAEPLARFEREAKMLAAMNHPDIADIYASKGLTGSAPW